MSVGNGKGSGAPPDPLRWNDCSSANLTPPPARSGREADLLVKNTDT